MLFLMLARKEGALVVIEEAAIVVTKYVATEMSLVNGAVLLSALPAVRVSLASV